MVITSYRPRVVDWELDEVLRSVPALALEGAKGVGKTATATQRAVTTFALDDPAQLDIAKADPSRLVNAAPPVLIDEWQRMPEAWDLVRRAVDQGSPPGRYLLTGSASPAGLGTHSGAGRIISVRMRPLALSERGLNTPTVSLKTLLAGAAPAVEGHAETGLDEYTAEILASGFPGLRGMEGRALRAELDGYLTRIVDRDFPDLGHQLRNPMALRRWMTAYAAASSTTASFETIRDASTAGQGEKPAKTAVTPYRDVLERLWILDPVLAWQPRHSQFKRLTSPPKHQLADPALAAQLLGVDAGALLSGKAVGPAIPRDGTLLGALFESLVTLSVRVYAQSAEADVFHLRTKAGEREVDLIVARPDGRVVAIEVKLTRTVDERDVRHLLWLREQLGEYALDAVVITTGPDAYRRQDGVAVVPAVLLGP